MSVGHYSLQTKHEPRERVVSRSVAHNQIKAAASNYLALDAQLRILPESAGGTRYDQLIQARDLAARNMAAAIARLS